MKNLILASQSAYKKELLERLHYPFQTMAPTVNESEYKDSPLAASELSLKLAHLKAQSVLESHPEAIVIGCDQVCCLNNEILSKPGNAVNALTQLKKMQGKTHLLHTSVAVISAEERQLWTNTTTLEMRELSDKQISAYLEIDKPFDCAGSYKIERAGISLMQKVTTNDSTSIIGLPLIELQQVLIDSFELPLFGQFNYERI